MERENWDRRWRERGFHCEDDPSDLLESELSDLAPGRALDLGCGAGRASIWLAGRGWRVTGVDFSEAALELARASGADVDWVPADLNDYEPEPAASDLVLVLYVHLPAAERQALLARATDALAPGGTLVVVGHDLTNLGTGAPGPSNPDVLYTPETIADELPGLDVEKAERVGDEAIDTVVRARKR
jgi:SAM-dependent methyltransferase